jgi:hypothetical protein
MHCSYFAIGCCPFLSCFSILPYLYDFNRIYCHYCTSCGALLAAYNSKVGNLDISHIDHYRTYGHLRTPDHKWTISFTDRYAGPEHRGPAGAMRAGLING